MLAHRLQDRVARAGAVLVVGLAGACGSSPSPASSPPAARPALPLPPPEAPPARWVYSRDVSGRASAPVAGGTVILVGGRRALVAADGTVRMGTAAALDPLLDLASVPTSAGPRLVGLGNRSLYAFDDPLGPPVAALANLGFGAGYVRPGPGVAAIFPDRDMPLLLDVQSGAPRSGLLPDAATDVAFSTLRDGAAILYGLGLAATSDGGASWHRLREAHPGDGARVERLIVRGSAVLARGPAGGRGAGEIEAAIDLAGGALGPLAPAREEPAIVRWLGSTHKDPFGVAVDGAAEAPGGDVVIAAGGLVARFDPRTGTMAALAGEAARFGGACEAAGHGARVFVACVGDLSEGPFMVRHVSFDGPGLSVGEPVLRTREPESARTLGPLRGLVSSPSGGLLFAAPCEPAAPGDACVLQPDGTWATFVPREGGLEAPGPLADGRLAFVRGLAKGDTAPTLGIVLRSRDGKEEALAPFPRPAAEPGARPLSALRVIGAIEEDERGVLHAVLGDTDARAYFVLEEARGAPASVHPLAGVVGALVHEGKGVATAKGRVLVSSDWGLTWEDVPVPPSLGRLRALEELWPASFGVSTTGLRFGEYLRLGWGPRTAPPDDPARPDAPQRDLPRQASAARRHLACTAAGEGSGIFPSSSDDLFFLLPGPTRTGAAVLRPPMSSLPPGATRVVGTDAPLRPALLEEERASAKDPAPTRWTFHWTDVSELGARARSYRGAAPEGATFGSLIESAEISGARAVFIVKSGAKAFWVRIDGRGRATIIAAPDLSPPDDHAVFGRSDADPVVWSSDDGIFAWPSGGAPRRLFWTHERVYVGVPTATAVPALIARFSTTDRWSGWGLLRELPIAAAAEPAPWLPLDGWRKVDEAAASIAGLPACDPSVTGPEIRLHTIGEEQLPAPTSTAERGPFAAEETVRFSGSGACLVGLVTTLEQAADGLERFLRIDFTTKKGETGLPGSDTRVRRLACSMEAER